MYGAMSFLTGIKQGQNEKIFPVVLADANNFHYNKHIEYGKSANKKRALIHMQFNCIYQIFHIKWFTHESISTK